MRRRGELIPTGYSWPFVLVTDVSLLVLAAVASLQRPTGDVVAIVIAVCVAVSPPVMFFVSGIKWSPAVFWATSFAAASIFLFATTAPVEGDFAPLFLVLMVAHVGALASVVNGLAATASAAALLLTASAMHRLDTVALYLQFVAIGWLVGYLMRTQQQLIVEQIEAQQALAEHAAGDERRRIAREVHDVIAHSLSVTLLHVTGARRALQEDRDVDDAVEALEQAEQLGRQAMADIRRTVGLLDAGPRKITPEPGVDDIPGLIDDFVHAGLNVALRTEGPAASVTPTVGLALYRIVQESLTNIAKHAPDAKALVVMAISPTVVTLVVVNKLPLAVIAGRGVGGRGLRGMRQRVELLGGVIDVGPSNDCWAVRANIPLGAEAGSRTRWCAS